MKKLASLLGIAALLLCMVCSVSLADTIKVGSLQEPQLYQLYSQVQSQRLLHALEGKDEYSASFDYKDFERNPSKHTDEKIFFTGTIIQVVEGDHNEVLYRVAKDNDYDQVFVMKYVLPEEAEHILDQDTVDVYAVFHDVTTYNSTTNLSVTVPYCEAALVVRPVANKTVAAASDDELAAALEAIDTRLAKVVKKDKAGNQKVTKSNFDDYARNESHHANESITLTGKVIQVTEGTPHHRIRVAVDSDTTRIMFVLAANDDNAIRVLEDDIITVQGKYSGLYTYTSTGSGEITIPSCTAENVSVKGYTAPTSFPKDGDGIFKLTKKLFEDFSRRPGRHEGERIKFNAKVIQVIEGDDESEYRMAVDSDQHCIMFVTIAKANRSTRILEDDKVVVAATFDGLISYSATSGAKITIPACTASSIQLTGQNAAARPSKNKAGQYTVHKENYESFSRDESTYMDEPLTFSAKVVQVSEGGGYTLYRMAVDKDINSMFLAILTDDNKTVRILEDDIVNVAGTSAGLYSYQSTRGGQITIPSCNIKSYTIDGYKAVNVTADGNGRYTVTKGNYETFARDPDPYAGKQITFNAKVIQVVERANGNNIYRVAVDSDNNCVFYVEYTLPAGSSRILEKDVITLTGEFYGLYTYSTTMGSSITIPALIASDIQK